MTSYSIDVKDCFYMYSFRVFSLDQHV